jgi:hypothetical protein
LILKAIGVIRTLNLGIEFTGRNGEYHKVIDFAISLKLLYTTEVKPEILNLKAMLKSLIAIV